jgi:hypothetical protein
VKQYKELRYYLQIKIFQPFLPQTASANTNLLCLIFVSYFVCLSILLSNINVFIWSDFGGRSTFSGQLTGKYQLLSKLLITYPTWLLNQRWPSVTWSWLLDPNVWRSYTHVESSPHPMIWQTTLGVQIRRSP